MQMLIMLTKSQKGNMENLKKEKVEDIEDIKKAVKQYNILHKAFIYFCRDEHPYLVANGEKFKVANFIMDGNEIKLLALDDKEKHLEMNSNVIISEKDQKSVEMVVESYKLGLAWLKKK